MCRNSTHGGRRCPYDTSPERNAKRRAAYGLKKTENGGTYRPHTKTRNLNPVTPSRFRKNKPVYANTTKPSQAPEGFVKLYHGTPNPDHLDSIGEKGLEQNPNTFHPAKWFMLTTSYEQALQYGNGYSVVEFTLPEEALKYRHELGCVWPGVEHDVYNVKATAYAPKGTVPEKYITAFYEPEAQ